MKRQVPGSSLNFLCAIIAAQDAVGWREVARTQRSEILLRLDEVGLAPKLD